MGGMLAAIEAGYVQREIERAAYDYQKGVETGREIVVGVNRFKIEEETPVPTLKVDPAVERAQIERLRRVRAERNSGIAIAALESVEEAARSGDNLMPPIIAAVEAHATLGEVADRMRAVFGEYSEAEV
jgi:methylmalonyl-CoA mutase N-terminal domain/subunit